LFIQHKGKQQTGAHVHIRVLVAGWFSFEQMGTTAGDLLARDLACDWIKEAGLNYDVALAPPFHGGVNWKRVRPSRYSHVVFVCGPFGNGWPIPEFLERFKRTHLTGIDLTMLDPLDVWNPFDHLLERDSSVTSRPDIAFLSRERRVPVVGVVRVHPQKEYKAKARHEAAEAAIQRLITSREMAVVNIDTRLDTNATGLRTPSEVESLIARMDAVVTRSSAKRTRWAGQWSSLPTNSMTKHCKRRSTIASAQVRA
jgi:hypothetical protein